MGGRVPVGQDVTGEGGMAMSGAWRSVKINRSAKAGAVAFRWFVDAGVLCLSGGDIRGMADGSAGCRVGSGGCVCRIREIQHGWRPVFMVVWRDVA